MDPEETSVLNFPYYFYPNVPFCGYMNIDEYNKNLIKLENLITEFKLIDRSILFHLSAGAAAEEILSEHFSIRNTSTQWTQLFPQHLHRAIENNIEVVHIIVAPNKNFSSDSSFNPYCDPKFIENTNDELQWEKNENCYKSGTKKIKVYVFYTMLPTIDHRNEFIIKSNTVRFNNICKTFKNHIVKQYLIDTYRQTLVDRKYVKKFYKNLEESVNQIKMCGGVSTCFSFATFARDTDKYQHGLNYNMFKEILNVKFDVLCDWKFGLDNYNLEEYTEKNELSYLDDSISIINENNEKLSVTF